VHVHRLRSKLGDRTGRALQTVRGVGYRWSPRAARSA
jgi:DNA-binding response OmpR family regulator